MYNDEQFDAWAKGILEDGREIVPDHVWDGVSAGLDRLQKKRPVVLNWRRIGSAVAVAAALASVLFLRHPDGKDFVPEPSAGHQIAVIGSEPASIDMNRFMLAEAKELKDISRSGQHAAGNAEYRGSGAAGTTADAVETDKAVEAVETGKAVETVASAAENEENAYRSDAEYADVTAFSKYSSDVEWEEDEEDAKKSRIRTSVVLSGIAGSNNARPGIGTGPLRLPSMTTVRPQTGVRQTSTETTYGIPLSFGTGVKIGFTPRWSLGIGLNYTLLTRDFYGTYTKANDNGRVEVSQQSDIRNMQHYIGIPVNAYYNIVVHEKVNFYAYAGGAVEKSVGNRYRVMSSGIIHKEQAKGVQLSVDAGIGAEFKVGEYLGIYIDPSLRYYFNNRQPKSIRTEQPLMFGFEIGLRVNL